MINVVGITFKDNGKVYYFLPGKINLKKNITVIVQTDRGLQFGKVVTDIIQIDESKMSSPLKQVVRIASKNDYYNNLKNIKDAKEALNKCKGIVEKEKLPMQIIDAEFTLDRSQLVFKFISDNRIDFRLLVKQLASIYKTRIELRQVGVRDKAKEVGGIGVCGCKLCCARFLHDLESVSINMAKNQNIALNPNKINGVCGRLLCCLKYEDECYRDCRKCLPKIGDKVKTDKGMGQVISLDILEKSYKVDVENVGIIEIHKEC
ncbi:MAG: stage 0 sporulation family protein [Bacilli bacterium]|nr:stage 0 sporulation family protein [Bacilli bacterium]